MRRVASVAWAFFVALTFNKSWLVNGVATAADSVTIGIYDDTAGLQVVAPGTAMASASTGQYSYAFTAALPEHSYTATIVVTYQGHTYTFNATAQATERKSEAERGREEYDIERALRENAASAESVQSAAGSVKSHPIPDQILAADREAVIRARRRGQIGAPLFSIMGEGPR
jgi:hypothetical protein